MKNALNQGRETLLAFFLAFFVTIGTSALYFSELVQTPKQDVFIGVTHYWEDFYYYLDQFYQGAHGGWLTVNNFTTEKTIPLPFYFSHIILGKIGGILGLQSFETYNLSLFVLKFVFMIVSYLLIAYIFPRSLKYRLSTFVIFLFSTSFPRLSFNNGQLSISAFELFRGENTVFSRFGSVPNSYISNTLAAILIIIFYRLILGVYQKTKRTNIFSVINFLIIQLVSLFLAISDYAKGLFLFPIAFLLIFRFSFYKKQKIYNWFNFFTVASSLITYLILGIFLKNMLGSSPAYTNATQWDLNQSNNLLINLIRMPYFFPLSFGISGICFILGTFVLLRKQRTAMEDLSLIISFIGLFGYVVPFWNIIPIPGFRLLFPTVYIFYSVVVLYGLGFVVNLIYAKYKLSKNRVWACVIILYVSINALTFIPTFLDQFKPLYLTNYGFSYMPRDLYNGLRFLEKLTPKNAAVVANSKSLVDGLIPGLTGKKSLTGHFLMTINEPYKRFLSDRLFLRSFNNETEAKNFLKKNQIKYVFFTAYDGDPNLFYQKYPFLKVVFQNSFVIIFSV